MKRRQRFETTARDTCWRIDASTWWVVDRYFIETLGLDPDDPDWKMIGFDWVRQADVAARTRLYSKLVAQLPREAA